MALLKDPAPDPNEARTLICVIGALLNVFILFVNPDHDAKKMAIFCIAFFAFVQFLEWSKDP